MKGELKGSVVYVCLGRRHPVKQVVYPPRSFSSGDRLEFEGKIVEVGNIYTGKGGIQLEVFEA